MSRVIKARYLLAIASLVFGLQNSGLATTPVKEKASVRITSMDIIGSPSHGQTVILSVGFRSFVDAKATLSLRFSDGINPGKPLDHRRATSVALYLKNGSDDKVSLPLIINSAGASMIEATMTVEEAPGVPAGFSRSAYRHIIIESDLTSFMIFSGENSIDSNIKVVTTSESVYENSGKEGVYSMNYNLLRDNVNSCGNFLSGSSHLC